MNLSELHGRLATLLSLTALLAFVSGAGLDAPASLPVLALLLLAAVRPPSERLARRFETLWRVLAVVLMARAAYFVLFVPEDVVLPMVDLLLVLLAAEALRRHDLAGHARVYALSFALLLAAAAYRPGVLFAVAFVAYVVLATLTLTVGHLTRAGAGGARVPRRYLAHWAASSGFVLLGALLVFAAFPRVSRGWVSRSAPPARSVVGFGDRVSLGEHGARLESNPAVVLRVEFPDGAPGPAPSLYWRGRSYDRFDGIVWSRTPRAGIGRGPPIPPRGAEPVRQTIYAVPLEVPVLFGLHPVALIEARSRIRTFQEPNGDWRYAGGAAPVYEVVSADRSPHPARLRATTAANPPGGAAYVQLPPLSGRVLELADSLTAGATTDYDRAVAVQRWLRSDFAYTLELPATARQATLEYFLFERRAGHCEYFSTAMAVLLRAAGIPTRNVNGFLGGEWNTLGGYLLVDQNRAHSWVEVWFEGVGWVAFDPTPAGVGVAAGVGRGWLGPLRFVMDGLEHRWGKWVLDYDLERQLEVARRAGDAFSRPPRAPDGGAPPGPPPWLVLGGLLALAAGAVLVRALLGRRYPPGAPTRAYMGLRRAYERAGFPAAERSPPLAFVGALHRADAPGREAAERAVRRYAAVRFGAAELDEAGRRALAADVAEARRALRRAGTRSAAR
ncbi:MAG: transglutaminaseTgpA domain-containing protein [Gemmatimonadota bacterium]